MGFGIQLVIGSRIPLVNNRNALYVFTVGQIWCDAFLKYCSTLSLEVDAAVSTADLNTVERETTGNCSLARIL